jgi:carbonic anhydrase
MTNTLKNLFIANKTWVSEKLKADRHYFKRLVDQQSPDYLWIGCSDSRIPPNEIVGLAPGELFVHRNVGNIVVHTDMNCLSVLQFAIDILKVKHVIVCGHYGCSGVRTAMDNEQHGLIDNWLRNIKDVYKQHLPELMKIKNPEARMKQLCELNVREQVLNVCYTRFVQNAFDRKQDLTVHGWIYDVGEGLLKDLGLSITKKSQFDRLYHLNSNDRSV